MASTAPISQPSQYMTATTRQITPDASQKLKIRKTDLFNFKMHFWVSLPNIQLHILPRMVMSTGSSSSGCAVNTDTAATQMPRDSSRLQRALSTPTSKYDQILHAVAWHTDIKPHLTCLLSPWRSASNARRSETPGVEQMTAAESRAAPGWSSPIEGSQRKSERRISPCTWSCREGH